MFLEYLGGCAMHIPVDMAMEKCMKINKSRCRQMQLFFCSSGQEERKQVKLGWPRRNIK